MSELIGAVSFVCLCFGETNDSFDGVDNTFDSDYEVFMGSEASCLRDLSPKESISHLPFLLCLPNQDFPLL